MKTAFLFPGQGSQFVGMAKDGFEDFIELGPGIVLTRLGKRINREVNCRAIGTSENINSL